MDTALQILISAADQWAVFSLLAIGTLVSFRIIRFPDLTIDGSFLLGAAAYARVINLYALPWGPWLALAAAFGAGAFAGFTTGFLSERLRINRFLAGIVVTTGSYSVALRLMGGANLPLSQSFSLLTAIDRSAFPDALETIALSGVALSALFMVALLLWTEVGLQLRAVGDNLDLQRSLGRRADVLVISGLMLANGLVGLGGGLLTQQSAGAYLDSGAGMLVAGLACMFIGDAACLYTGISLLRRGPIIALISTAVLGSFAYCAIRAGARELRINQTDLKGATALVVVVALLIGRQKRQPWMIGDETL